MEVSRLLTESEEGDLHTEGFEREEGQAQCQQGSLSDTGRLSQEHNATDTAEKGHLLMLALAAAWNSCKQTYRRVEPVCRDQGTETAVEMSRECLLCRKMSTRCLPTTEKTTHVSSCFCRSWGTAGAEAQQEPGELKPQHYRGGHIPSVCKVSPTGMSFWPQGKGSGRPRNSQRNLPLPNQQNWNQLSTAPPAFMKFLQAWTPVQPGTRTHEDYQTKAKGFLETDRRAVVGQQNGVLYHCFKGGQGDLDELLRSRHP